MQRRFSSFLLLLTLSGLCVITCSHAVFAYPQSLGTKVSYLPPNTEVELTVMLPPRNTNTLLSLAERVSSGETPPISQDVILKQFSPSEQAFQALESYFVSQGFRINYVSADRFVLGVSGSASLIERVFKTKLVLYDYNGEIYYAPENVPVIPSALYGTQIVGLSNRSLVTPYHIILGALHGSSVQPTNLPHSTPFYPSLQYSYTFYTPQVFQEAYDITPLLSQGYTGKEVSVAVIDVFGDPLIQEDLARFDNTFHLPPINLTIVPIGEYQPDFGVFTGWDVETALDVEAVHSVAPYAKVYLVVASNPANALFEAVDYVVSSHVAQVVSMSWGIAESLLGASGFYIMGSLNYPYLEYYFALGSAEGISFFASSGDEGAFGGTPSVYGGVSYPSSSPFVTSVGGTTLFVNVINGSIASMNENVSYSAEDAWSISPEYAGATVSSGGGYSTLFPVPWYQAALGLSARATPDVSADANPYTGAIVIAEGDTFVVGGTSLSSPLWAGMTADLIQYLGHPLGLFNSYLYEIYQNSALYNEAFHQVALGFNGAYYAHQGYNLVTGIGTPNLFGLARALKALKPSLSVSVSVEGGSAVIQGYTYPQFNYGSNVKVVSEISYPNGSLVTSGDVVANVYTLKGEILSLPLSFNGSYWVTSFTIPINAPPNSWMISVSASAGGLSGFGATEIQVGLTLGILAPIPYPYAPPIEPNQPFSVMASASYPNGTPISNMSLTASFEKNGRTLFKFPLLPVSGEPGIFSGTYALLPNLPQGVYTLVINGSVAGDSGESYTYEYFGEAIVGGLIFTPIIQAIPSASPGETVTLATQTLNASFGGVFTSNLSAEFYNEKGALVAKVELKPAPNSVQYGLFNFFFGQEANFTIPQNFTSGFYTVVFNSSVDTPNGLELGYYTTGLYISSSSLSYKVSAPAFTLEGQNVKVQARIWYQNGTPVTSGVFSVTLLPTNYQFASLFFDEFTGVPMQYNATQAEWVAEFELPSILSGGFYQGLPQSYLSGSWSVIVSGESQDASSSNLSYSYIDVLPYTMLPYHAISSNVTQAALVSRSGSGYTLTGVGAPNLSINGLNISLSQDYFGSLVIKNSFVTLSNSFVSEVRAYNSTLVVVSTTFQNSRVALLAVNSGVNVSSSRFVNVEYAFSPVGDTNISVQTTSFGSAKPSTLPQPALKLVKPSEITGGVKAITLNATGENLRVVSVELNGEPLTPSVTKSASGVVISVPFSSSGEPDGVYTLSVTLSDGLSYSYQFTIVNAYHEHVTLLIFEVVSVVAIALSVVSIFLRRR